MNQTHSQIKLTPKPIDLDEVISFVSNKNGGAICSHSGVSNKQTTFPDSEDAIVAQATLAQKELDEIVTNAFEAFDLNKIAIHYKLGNLIEGEIFYTFSISSESIDSNANACKFLIEKLSGNMESWNEEIMINVKKRKQ